METRALHSIPNSLFYKVSIHIFSRRSSSSSSFLSGKIVLVLFILNFPAFLETWGIKKAPPFHHPTFESVVRSVAAAATLTKWGRRGFVVAFLA